MALLPRTCSVFISYAHESEVHRQRVRALAERLRSEGVSVVFDQDLISPPEGWPRWMDREIREADFVLAICTESWWRRVMGTEEEGKGLGVRWEGNLIYQHIYNADSLNTRFVPVLFEDGNFEHIPTPLQGATVFRLDGDFRKLLAYICGTQTSAGVEPATPVRTSVWNVPLPTNPWFTGRDDFLAALRVAFLSGRRRAWLQVISGLGGVGKTQTAIEYAWRNRDQYSAVLWVRAETKESVHTSFSEIAGLLKLGPDDTVSAWLQRTDRWLLIFDNVDDPAVVKPVMPLEPRGHVLITSRTPEFQSLGVTQAKALDVLSAVDALAFLLARTGRERGNEAEEQAAEELAAELGFLPLALEQAGAYIHDKQSRFQHYLVAYRKRRLQLLGRQLPIAGEYLASVATTWDLNFVQVAQKSPAAVEVLYLSAFLSPDTVPLELLEKGAAKVGLAVSEYLGSADADPLLIDELLTPLGAYSLICRDLTTNAYSLHRLVQAVVRDRLDEPSRILWAERAVATVEHVFPADVTDWNHWLLCLRLLPHARVCLQLIDEFWLRGLEACRLVHCTGLYLYASGRLEEAAEVCKRACELWEEVVGALDENFAWAVNNLGCVLNALGRLEEAETLFRRSSAIFLDVNSPSAAQPLANLGSLLFELSHFDEAERSWQQALVSHPKQVEALEGLGCLYKEQSRYDEAEAHLHKALKLLVDRLGRHHRRLGSVLSTLKDLYQRKGDADKIAEFDSWQTQVLAMSLLDLPEIQLAVRNIINAGNRQRALQARQG